MTTSNLDAKTLKLIEAVARQKKEIKRLEKPAWKTNCSLTVSAAVPVQPLNLHVEANVSKLVQVTGWLLDTRESYDRAVKYLGIENPAPLQIQGYPVEAWLDDVKLRIDKIQIESKRKKLEVLEVRLNALLSPEQKAEIELQQIEVELLG